MTSQPSDRRKEPRRPLRGAASLAIKGGKNGYATLFCSFSDLSDSGACIVPPPNAKFKLGQSFAILHPDTGDELLATIVGISGQGLHLKFDRK